MFRLSTYLLLIISFFTSQINFAQPSLAADNIPKELLKNANVVIRNYDETIHFKHKKELKQVIDYSLTIMNSDGIYYLQHILNYKKSSDKVKINSIQLFDKNGIPIKKIKKKDIEDIASYDGYSMISDERRKMISIQPTHYPISIRCTYEISSSNTLHIPPFVPISNYNISVEKSHYKLINHSEIKIATKAYNFEQYSINKINDYEFQLTNQVAISKEKHSPLFLDIVPNNLFRAEEFHYEGHDGSFENWEDYGKWINESFLLEQNNLKKEELPDELNFLNSPSMSDIDKVNGLYKYIQDNTRYILITLDDGGLKPMKSGDVNELKYGDCKALSFYMYSILKMVDIPVKYGVVYAETSHQKSMDESFPNPYQANHIIVNVPLAEKDIWLDCTSSTNPFNFLGNFTDNRKVMLVDHNQTEIRKTPDYGASLNKVSSNYIIDYTNNKILLEKENHGIQMDIPIYIQKLDAKKRNEKIIENYIENVKSSKIAKYVYSENTREFNSIEKITINSNYIIEQIGEYTLLPNSITSFDLPNLGKKKKRKNPIYFPRTSIQEEQIKILIPESYEPTEELENYILENEIGRYEVQYEKQANTLIIKRTITINGNTYPTNKFKEIKTFFKEIKGDLNKKISIKKS